VLLGPDDNCVVVIRALCAGDAVTIDGQRFPIDREFGIGHKLARRPIARGEQVLKYGAPIGRATEPIAPGEHIHLHNLASDYIATWQRA